MNKNIHRLVFNKSRGCVVAVLETASNCSKSPSATSKARRRLSKCFKTSKNGQFHLSNKPIAQCIPARAALNLIACLSHADKQINLLAARNESSQSSTNSNSSSSIGASFSAKGISANASVSRGSGRSDGQDTSFSNTSIQAPNTAIIKSGGDTNVIGATVQANQIKADIGGSLKVESLQDQSTFTSNQKSMGASISIPITGSGSAGGSVSASKSNVDSNFQSVGQQSGLKAGDGGFQVSVNNNTALKGGVISSTQQAVNDNKNTFTTGGALSIADVQNTASFKGTAVGVSVGYTNGKPSGGAGTGSTGGNAASTSSAGISGIAGNTAVRTGDAETGLQRIFDADKVHKEINAQVAITQAFGQQASKAIGDYAATQVNEAARLRIRANGLDANDPERTRLSNEAAAIEAKWGDSGTLRLLAHTVVGGLTGGASGAAGAAAGTLAAPLAADALANAGITGPLATSITALAGTAAGALAGGTAGAAAGFNEVVNNYLTPRENLARNRAARSCGASNYTDSKSCGEANRLNNLDKTRDNQIAAAVSSCQSSNDAQACNNASNMVNDLKNKGMLELQQLAIELAPTCAAPRDCTQAANWGSTELSTLYKANQLLWPYVASGAVQGTAGPEMALFGLPSLGGRMLAGQMALAPEATVTGMQWAAGSLKSAAISTGIYAGSNILNPEDLTLANLATAAVTGAIGSGLVRRGLNLDFGLPNRFIPLTAGNALTQSAGIATGFAATGWLNQTGYPSSGNSIFTSPVINLLPAAPSPPPSVIRINPAVSTLSEAKP